MEVKKAIDAARALLSGAASTSVSGPKTVIQDPVQTQMQNQPQSMPAQTGNQSSPSS